MTGEARVGARAHDDLARRSVHGALTSVLGQAVNFVLRIGSMIVIARLVTPEHFGLVTMVTAFTGLLGLFRDAGLSAAMVQRSTVSQELLSTLFWINLAIGIALALVGIAAAPLLVLFYGDPRLFWITVGIAAGFVFHGAQAQHRAVMQRRLRFAAITVIDIVSLVASIALSIGMALAGYGYWALVVMATFQPFAGLVGIWISARWTPGSPRLTSEVRSVLRYGGMLTLDSLAAYVAYNADKVLVGRFLGAEAVGAYGRAYQLITLPTDNLHTALSAVMFPALARVRDQPERLRIFFLSGFTMFLIVVTPITAACALFAEDIIRVFLGPQWDAAVPVFRLLAPMGFALSLMQPTGYLMQACGHAVRSLKISLLVVPVTLIGCAWGLGHGVEGVAIGLSGALVALAAPVLYLAVRGTKIRIGDVLLAVAAPCLATAIGSAAAFAVWQVLPPLSALVRVSILSSVLFAIHATVIALLPHTRLLMREARRNLRRTSDSSSVSAAN
jgi:O-antigen/teichoic acid export membrane protein